MKSRKKKNKYLVCHDVYGKKYKVPLKNFSFRPAVYAIIIKNNKVLLSPQWDGYDFPGGGIKLGETLDEAFEREVKEETGLKVKRGRLIVVESSFYLERYPKLSGIKFKKPWHSILIYCFGKIVKGKITNRYLDDIEKKYAKKAEWIDIKAAKRLKFYNSVSDSYKLIKMALKILKK